MKPAALPGVLAPTQAGDRRRKYFGRTQRSSLLRPFFRLGKRQAHSLCLAGRLRVDPAVTAGLSARQQASNMATALACSFKMKAGCPQPVELLMHSGPIQPDRFARFRERNT